MSSLSSYRPSPAMVVSLLALSVAVGGVAYAAIPASDGTIRGCYDPTSGSPHPLSVVDDPSECKSPFVLLPWNQTGPPGARGATGPAGTPGPAGPPGGAAIGQLVPKYWAEVDFAPPTSSRFLGISVCGGLTMRAYRASSGVSYTYRPCGADSEFVFDQDVHNCLPVVTPLHRQGRGGPEADRESSPLNGNDGSPNPASFSAYTSPSTGNMILVSSRQTLGPNNRGITSYVVNQAFDIVVFCPQLGPQLAEVVPTSVSVPGGNRHTTVRPRFGSGARGHRGVGKGPFGK
jgi:hypothetical protein